MRTQIFTKEKKNSVNNFQLNNYSVNMHITHIWLKAEIMCFLYLLIDVVMYIGFWLEKKIFRSQID